MIKKLREVTILGNVGGGFAEKLIIPAQMGTKKACLELQGRPYTDTKTADCYYSACLNLLYTDNHPSGVAFTIVYTLSALFIVT